MRGPAADHTHRVETPGLQFSDCQPCRKSGAARRPDRGPGSGVGREKRAPWGTRPAQPGRGAKPGHRPRAPRSPPAGAAGRGGAGEFQSTRPLRGGTAILHKKTVQNIAYCTKSAFTLAVLSGFLALMRPFFLPNVHKFRCEPSEESLLAPRSHAYTIRTPSG